MRMWNDTKYSHGWVALITILPISIIGFMVYPEAGLLAPILFVLTILLSVYLIQYYNRFKLKMRMGNHLISDKRWAQVSETSVWIDGEKIEYSDIVKCGVMYSGTYEIKYQTNSKENVCNIHFYPYENLNSFKYDFEEKYEAFKINNCGIYSKYTK